MWGHMDCGEQHHSRKRKHQKQIARKRGHGWRVLERPVGEASTVTAQEWKGPGHEYSVARPAPPCAFYSHSTGAPDPGPLTATPRWGRPASCSRGVAQSKPGLKNISGTHAEDIRCFLRGPSSLLFQVVLRDCRQGSPPQSKSGHKEPHSKIQSPRNNDWSGMGMGLKRGHAELLLHWGTDTGKERSPVSQCAKR